MCTSTYIYVYVCNITYLLLQNFTSAVEALRIMGALLGALLIPLDHHTTVLFEGIQGALNWAPMMPTDDSLEL